MAGVQTLSGHILAKSLLPELKTSLKRSLGALVLVKNQKFRGKKLTFFFFLVLAKKSRFLERFFYCSPFVGAKWGGAPSSRGRAHPHGVAGGWRVRKCHFRGLKHLRAVKIFPLTRVACGQPGEAHLDVGLID